jgi:hypothetical protein
VSSAAALVLAVAPVTPSHPPSSTEPIACVQSAYMLHGVRQEDRFTWVLETSSIPPYLPRDATVHAIVAATDTVAQGHTPCPGRELLGAGPPPAVFGGGTSRGADVTPEGRCVPDRNSDGISTVSFGRLPAGSVAVSCTYTHAGDIWQADVLLSDEAGLFTTSPADPDCTDAYDLQAVVTHERGHSFGLGDVPESPTTDELTMSTFAGRCDAAARTLARGDVLGLKSQYATRP